MRGFHDLVLEIENFYRLKFPNIFFLWAIFYAVSS
jgi:hypothetical protein